MKKISSWLKKNILTKRYSKPYFDDKAFRVFCISVQRTGTTSVGKFFRDFGFFWAGWPQTRKNNWTFLHYEGNYESIFLSDDFRRANAFEDSPWWYPGFYKVLYSRFPNSKFVLFIRDPDDWFRSMLKHSGGNILGQPIVHSKNYRREKEYFELFNEKEISFAESIEFSGEKAMKLFGHEEHYKEIYQLHTMEAIDFFRRNNPDALFTARLEDKNKWVNLGKFLGLNVPLDYVSHENASA